jgi:plasmid stabilization system protein ParE
MTARVIRSRRAEAEIEEITAFLEEHSVPAMQRFLASLERAEQLLSEYPDIGAPGARPGTRRLIVGSYILSYRGRGQAIEIFAVRDARRRNARF